MRRWISSCVISTVPSAVFIGPLVYGINPRDSSEVLPMLRKACVCVVFTIFASTLSFAQAPSNQQRNRVDYGIRGRIIIPIPRESEDRIEVKLETAAYQMIQTSYTDSSGNFDFRGLSPGAYYVSVNVEGFEPVRQLVEIFTNFSSTAGV